METDFEVSAWDKLASVAQAPIPGRLSSLLTMLPFYAKRILAQLAFVEQIEGELTSKAPQALGRSVSQLNQLGQMAGQLGFKHLEEDGARVFQLSGEGKITDEIALHESREFRRRLLEEMARHLFFMVPAEDRHYYEKRLLSKEAASSFPAADQELEEAGKCFALGRFSAAVYHSMRALEVGLIAMARRLAVPVGNKPWGGLIRDCENRITESWTVYRKKNQYDEQEQSFLELCSDAATNFRFLKDAWRNVAMHERKDYSREKAEAILSHVSQFLEDLSRGGICEQP